MNNISEKALINLRLAMRDYSLHKLAKETGISASYLGDIRTGRKNNVAPDKINRIISVMGLDVYDIEQDGI